LIQNGVKTITDNSIKFRQLFIEDQPIDFIDDLSDKDVFAGLDFFVNTVEIKKPFEGNQQINILKKIKNRKNAPIISSIYNEDLTLKSKEWDSPEYIDWRMNDTKPKVFLYQSQMPKNMHYGDVLISTYKEDDYFYDKNNRKLFLNSKEKENLDDLLFRIAREGKCDFSLDDYKLLCKDGKTLIKTEEFEKINRKIVDLEQQIKEKDSLLEKYIEKHGAIDDDNFNEIKPLSTSQLKYIKTVITKPNLSQEEQIGAHKEAEHIVREKLIQDGYDCTSWVLDDNDNANEFEKWHSVNQVENIKNQKGDTINLVIKSAKGGYIYLSATDFEFLTSNSNNILMVWDGKHVHSVTGDEIFDKDSNVNLIFDTEYTPKHYYAALSKVFQFVKRTTFAVKNPSYNAYDSIQSFGIDAKTEGVQKLFDDKDL
jgi:hypothetical protein